MPWPKGEGMVDQALCSQTVREDNRSCALSREPMAKEDMIRFVAGPEEIIVADIRARLPGRGVWITATHKAIAEAARRNVFARSLKKKVKVPAALADNVEAMLRQDLLQALALANKAGAVVTGFSKVEALAAAGDGKKKIAALIHAQEAAHDGRRKLLQALRRSCDQRSDAILIIDCFEGAHLDLALGRMNVIHAAVIVGAGSDGFMARWRKLDRYRTDRNLTCQAKADGILASSPSGEESKN